MDRLEGIGARALAERTAWEYGVEVGHVVAKGRGKNTRNVSAARQHLWSLLHGSLGLSTVEIGKMFEVHHSSVHQALVKRREVAEAAA